MATTLQNIIDACEADLGDSGNATWSAADITQWCRDAIADYSVHFPRVLTDTITTSDDDRTYDLNADFLDPISVEYPTGEDPARQAGVRDSSSARDSLPVLIHDSLRFFFFFHLIRASKR